MRIDRRAALLLGALVATIAPLRAQEHPAPAAGEHEEAHAAAEEHGGTKGPVADKGRIAGAMKALNDLRRQEMPIVDALQKVRSDMNLSREDVATLQKILSRSREHGRGSDSSDATGRLLVAVGDQRVAMEPSNPRAYADGGRGDYIAGDYRRSYEMYHRAIELGSTDPVVYVGYGSAAYKLGDYRLAARAAGAVLAADPRDQTAIALYESAKDRSSTVVLPSAFGDGPAPASAAVGGGTSPAPRSDSTPTVSARVLTNSTTPEAQRRPTGLTRSAAEALALGDYGGAVDAAGRALAIDPRDAQAFVYRAMAESRQGRYQLAVADAGQALSLAPGSAAALQTRSWAFSRSGQYRQGEADAMATLERDPSSAYALQNLAFARAGLGDREGALSALERSAQIDPRFAERFDRASALPRDADLTLLFREETAAGAAAPRGRSRRLGGLVMLTLLGGGLVALGAINLMPRAWLENARRTMTRGSATGSGPTTPPVPSGAFWSQFEMIREIGHGGMGVVYEVRDRALDRRVAVKRMRDEIRADADERRRFLREARLVAQLRHPGIVEIFGVVEDQGEVYLVFEYVEGRTLEAEISAGPMDPVKAAAVAQEVAAAIDYAHLRGVVHEDLKPSNIMLLKDGTAKVMDFGVARQAKDAVTRRATATAVSGTPPYMAPEQEQGAVRKESDIFGLGVCLYEMTTGKLPFIGTGAAMLLAKLNGRHAAPSSVRPSLGPAFDAAIARALDPNPDRRFASAGEFARTVAGAVGHG